MIDFEKQKAERLRVMARERLTSAHVTALSGACWGLKHFGGGLMTNRQVRLRAMQGLHVRAFVSPIEAVYCDGDGFTKEPERWGTAWRPTSNGIALALELREIDEDEAVRLLEALLIDVEARLLDA